MEGPLKATIGVQLATVRDLLADLCADAGLIAVMEAVARRGAEVLRAGGKILFLGNGGSAADAQHLAAELVGRYAYDRPGLAAVALTTDASILTAVGNDAGFERVFARQLEALARRGDMLIAMSTSGRSRNVIEALRTARGIGVTTVGLTGQGGGVMAEWCDHVLAMPSLDTPRIQEGHKVVGHILCGLLEQLCCPRPAIPADDGRLARTDRGPDAVVTAPAGAGARVSGRG
jgi:D-sedoheptulose 7-phosphate isomerase